MRKHVFISYAKEDSKEAALLNEYLKVNNIVTWIDYERLLPGQQWQNKIKNAIREARAIIFIASNSSVNKRGFVQKEVKEILNQIEEFPTGDISVIVVRLENVEMRDEEFLKRQWVDLFPEINEGYQSIITALHTNELEELKRVEQQEIANDKKAFANKMQEELTKEKLVKADKTYDFAPGTSVRLFMPDELDVYVNKVSKESFIFHGKIIDYESIDYLEYHYNLHYVIVVYSNGNKVDLGVKIQWLVRPYFEEADEVSIVRTENGKSIDGTVVPLKKLGKARKVSGKTKNVPTVQGALKYLSFRNWINKLKDS